MTTAADCKEYEEAKRNLAEKREALDIARTAYWQAERRFDRASQEISREITEFFSVPVKD